MAKKHGSLRHLIRAVAFLCVLALLLSAVSAFTYPKTSQGIRKYHAEYIFGEPADSLDYVFVGSSNVSEGFSPLDVWNASGAAGYSCSEPWATLCRDYYLLRNIFKKQHPKLVLLDTDGFFFDKGTLTGTEAALNTVLQENFSTFRYHDRWKKLTWQTLFTTTDYSIQDLLKGHAFNTTIKPSTNVSYMKATSALSDDVPLLLKFYMQRIIQLCSQNGAQILIVSIPSTSYWNMARHNRVQQYADSLGLRFIDLNLCLEEIGIDWNNDTRDKGMHLNAYGAQKVSVYMGSYLKEYFDLPDHRGEDAYASWDTRYQQYLTKFTKKS